MIRFVPGYDSEETENVMRIGAFTPLLSQLTLAAVLKKLAALQINTVELGTGNYPGDAHCKLPTAIFCIDRQLCPQHAVQPG